VLTEVYPAGEAKILGADGKSLLKAVVTEANTQSACLNPKETAFASSIAEMPEKLSSLLRDGDVLITMGAGSISNLSHDLAGIKHA